MDGERGNKKGEGGAYMCTNTGKCRGGEEAASLDVLLGLVHIPSTETLSLLFFSFPRVVFENVYTICLG